MTNTCDLIKNQADSLLVCFYRGIYMHAISVGIFYATYKILHDFNIKNIYILRLLENEGKTHFYKKKLPPLYPHYLKHMLRLTCKMTNVYD